MIKKLKNAKKYIFLSRIGDAESGFGNAESRFGNAESRATDTEKKYILLISLVMSNPSPLPLPPPVPRRKKLPKKYRKK